MEQALSIIFFILQMFAGMFLGLFGIIQAAFAGGWATGDRFHLIIGLLFVAIGFSVCVVFTSLLVRKINER